MRHQYWTARLYPACSSKRSNWQSIAERGIDFSMKLKSAQFEPAGASSKRVTQSQIRSLALKNIKKKEIKKHLRVVDPQLPGIIFIDGLSDPAAEQRKRGMVPVHKRQCKQARSAVAQAGCASRHQTSLGGNIAGCGSDGATIVGDSSGAVVSSSSGIDNLVNVVFFDNFVG